MEWLFLFLALAIVCFATWFYIQSEARKEKAQEDIEIMFRDVRKSSIYRLPPEDDFDEPLIKSELARLASEPAIFWQYVHQLKARFTKYNQTKVIDIYIGYAKKAAAFVEADIEVRRKIIERQNLDLENKLARKKLEADIEEQQTRIAKSLHERRTLGQQTKLAPKTEDELKFERKRSKRFTDIQDELFEQLELATYKDLQSVQLHKKLTLEIDRNPNLNEEEKYEMRQRLNRRFDEKRKEAGIYSDEEN
jgi:hypothetical protein